MNLKEFYEMQKVLDERIEREHPRQEGEGRLSKKILALQVELGELANEWRGFKFWSDNQEPRTYGLKLGKTPKENRYINPLLEEYVDCLHFILSIGLELKTMYQEEKLILNVQANEKKEVDITNQFHELFMNTTSLFDSTVDEYYDFEDTLNIYNELFETFEYLGEMLGFTWQQIEEAYFVKNKINHQRQESGY